MKCYVPTDDQHTGKCASGRLISRETDSQVVWERCNRPVKFHVNYGTGCAQMCGIHANQASRKHQGWEVTPISLHKGGG